MMLLDWMMKEGYKQVDRERRTDRETETERDR